MSPEQVVCETSRHSIRNSILVIPRVSESLFTQLPSSGGMIHIEAWATTPISSTENAIKIPRKNPLIRMAWRPSWFLASPLLRLETYRTGFMMTFFIVFVSFPIFLGHAFFSMNFVNMLRLFFYRYFISCVTSFPGFFKVGHRLFALPPKSFFPLYCLSWIIHARINVILHWASQKNPESTRTAGYTFRGEGYAVDPHWQKNATLQDGFGELTLQRHLAYLTTIYCSYLLVWPQYVAVAKLTVIVGIKPLAETPTGVM